MFSQDLEKTLFPTCRELGVGIVAYSPVGRGVFGLKKVEDLAPDDWRRSAPRFSPENWEKNRPLIAQVEDLAATKNLSPSQLALAWVMHQGLDIVPIPGTKRTKYLLENMAATQVKLTPEENQKVKTLGASVVGDRYPASAMATLNL